MKKQLAMATALAIITAGALPAFAEEDAGMQAPVKKMERMRDGSHARGGMLDKIDADGNKTISLEEFQAGAEMPFSHMDANGDQKLDESDVDAKLKDMKAKMLEKLLENDANGDGAVTLEEAKANAAEKFTALDADQSGELSVEEFRAHMKDKMKGRMGGHMGGPKGGAEMDPEGPLPPEQAE